MVVTQLYRSAPVNCSDQQAVDVSIIVFLTIFDARLHVKLYNCTYFKMCRRWCLSNPVYMLSIAVQCNTAASLSRTLSHVC